MTRHTLFFLTLLHLKRTQDDHHHIKDHDPLDAVISIFRVQALLLRHRDIHFLTLHQPVQEDEH